MKVKLLVISLVLAFLFSNLQAAESSSNRVDKIGLLGISSGAHIPTLVTHPLTAGYYFKDNILLGFEYGTASFSETDEDDKFELDYINTGVYMRYFLGNSLNVLGALHQRSWKAKATMHETFQECVLGTCLPAVSGDITGTVTGSALVATVGIANHWMMDYGLTVGFDWLVLSYPLSTTVSGVSVGTMGVSLPVSVADSRAKEMGDMINKISSLPGALVLTLGWSF